MDAADAGDVESEEGQRAAADEAAGGEGSQGRVSSDPPLTQWPQERRSRDLRDGVCALDALAAPLDCDDVSEDSDVAALRSR